MATRHSLLMPFGDAAANEDTVAIGDVVLFGGAVW